MAKENRRIVLASRPSDQPAPENFRFETVPAPEPGPGEVLLRTLWLSLDPYMRGRMYDVKSYAPPAALGAAMVGGTVAKVEVSNHPSFTVGDIVLCGNGWQDYAVSSGKGLVKLDPAAAPLSAYLGVLGMPGLTAYGGLLSIGAPKPGETLVVAAATGPVGSVVGQIARIKGCRAVGIAGGADKCAFLTDELGFDAAIDRRAPDLAAQLAAACPKGIDIYFENVGGAVFEAVLPLLNLHARMPVCGTLGWATEPPSAGDTVPALMRAILTRRMTVQGLLVEDFAAMAGDFHRDMAGWLRDGRVRVKEDVVNGLEQAPDAFLGMLKGRNFGKLLVKVADA